jgi:hypothetical protein
MKITSLKLTTCFLFVALSTVSVTSCAGDDDDDDTAATGGQGGSGGGAGESGSSGNSGRGGMGDGGEAGGGQAGAGTSGSAGTGTGGTGAISGAGGGGGEPGGAGSGGDGSGGQPDTESKSCAIGCDSEDDCATASADIRRCDPELMRCVECVAHNDCIPVASAWIIPCTEDDNCITALGEVCVGVNGRGYCAGVPDETLGCLFPGEVPITLPKFGVTPAETVEVCGKESGRCENHHCFTGCSDDPSSCGTGLNVGYGDSCNAATGRCSCESDSECTHGPRRCNPTTNRCDECGDASHCPGASEGKDVCAEGRCGCSGASVCTNANFPSGTPLCE